MKHHRIAPVWHRGIAAGAALVATAALAGCGSTSTTGSGSPTGQSSSVPRVASGQVGDLLTIGFPTAPPTLDPAQSAGNASIFYNALAYEPLIVLNNQGKYEPGLATSWKYVGPDNKTFVLELRKDVKFSDGSPLTAQGVVDYFTYLETKGGQNRILFAGATFKATGPLEVTMSFAQPNPDVVYNLSQDIMAGEVISDAALKNPTELGSATYGAGPYVLSKDGTTLGSQYTYVPNPNFYDPSQLHYKKIVIKVIQSPQSTLQALQTGQIDMALGDQSTVAQADAAGFGYHPADVTNNVSVVTLADRAGSLVPALKDPRVRQALNDATDREAIAKALYPGNPTTSAVATPGRAGYDPKLVDYYGYDVAKAKQLLAAAGYPNGFSMSLVTTEAAGQQLYAQAIAQQWKQIGVTVDVVDVANPQAYVQEALSGKYPAFTNNVNMRPIATLGTNLFLPQAIYNPFHSTDPKLTSLYQQEIVSSGAEQASLDQQIVGELTEQAWFVPIVSAVTPVYVDSKVAGAEVTPPLAFPCVYDLQPAQQG
jgi:peptide/nickel transport system substrate-binding protein